MTSGIFNRFTGYPNRKSIRFKGYDYSQAGVYFITVCTQNRICLFGEIMDGKMNLNELGQIVADEWVKSARIRSEIKLHEWVVMPNHFHAIVEIVDIGDRPRTDDRPVIRTGTGPIRPNGPKPASIGALMAGFKSAVTTGINRFRNTPRIKIWQYNYWDHIIRDANEYSRIRQYIINNALNWDHDKLMGGEGNRVTEPVIGYGEESWMI